MLSTIWKEIKSVISLRSLRVRIFFIILVVGIVPGVLMRYGIVSNYEERAVAQRVSTVSNQLLIVGNHLTTNNYFNTDSRNSMDAGTKKAINAELEMLADIYEGRVMIISADLKVMKDTYGISEGKTIISEEVIRCFSGDTTSNYDKEHGYIEMTTPVVVKGENGSNKVVGVMLTSISDESIAATSDVLSRNAMIIEALTIITVFALAVVLSILLTGPFKKLTNSILDAKSGDNPEAISVTDYVETVHIVDAYNQLLSKMRTLDESRQEFVANVSHELKTPMTSVKVLADSLLAQDNVPAELYREFMEDIVSEIDRENRIITDLLALVKLDKKAQEMNIASVNINELTELILKRLRPIARKMDVEVTFESMRTVMAEVDEVKISILITNLVENAIKYNKEHGWVKVALDADHQFFIFTVSDSGIGIPEDSLAKLYERFYRVDKSHSREIGGTGLGLAITKSAVLAHRGSITVESVEGEGTTFTVKIPLNYISASSPTNAG